MKNPLHYIHTYPLRTKQILGISYDQFLLLVQQAELINQKQLAEVEQNKVRVNAPGGGRKPKLTTEESVCLCLFYLRQMPTFEVLGMHFDVSKTEANNTFHYWIKIFRIILPSSLLEQVKTQESDLMIVQKLLTEFELIVDSMEQCRERPGSNEEQKKYFSGKKKQHTFKNQVVSMPEATEIVDVVVGVLVQLVIFLCSAISSRSSMLNNHLKAIKPILVAATSLLLIKSLERVI